MPFAQTGYQFCREGGFLQNCQMISRKERKESQRRKEKTKRIKE